MIFLLLLGCTEAVKVNTVVQPHQVTMVGWPRRGSIERCLATVRELARKVEGYREAKAENCTLILERESERIY